jgi:hypothetical protein
MEQERTNWFAIFGVLFAVSSLVLIIPLSLFCIALAVLGIVSSGIALWQIKKGAYTDGKWSAIIGLVLGGIAIVVISAIALSSYLSGG